MSIWINTGILPTKVRFSLALIQATKHSPLQLLVWLDTWEIWRFPWKKRRINTFCPWRTCSVSVSENYLCIRRCGLSVTIHYCSPENTMNRLLIIPLAQQDMSFPCCDVISAELNLIFHLWTCSDLKKPASSSFKVQMPNTRNSSARVQCETNTPGLMVVKIALDRWPQCLLRNTTQALPAWQTQRVCTIAATV